MVRIVVMWPLWMKELQQLKDAGKLTFAYDTEGVDGSHNFYDMAGDFALRDCEIFLDNAPYHLGAAVQLASKTKEEIAAILRKLDIKQLHWTRKDDSGIDTSHTVEVPAEKESWKVGFPNMEELREAAFKAIVHLKPNVVLPPYVDLLNPTDPKWGGKKIRIWRTPPYTPKWWPIELKWAYGIIEIYEMTYLFPIATFCPPSANDIIRLKLSPKLFRQ
jgi:hypothetical protein